MFIRKVKEGEPNYLGLNWKENENSFICFSLIIPIWIFRYSFYYDFETDRYQTGKRIKNLCFYFRIRKWYKFPTGVRRVIYDISSCIRAFGKQQLIATREMIEDGRCQ